ECLLALGLVDEATVYCALARQHGLVYPEPDEWSPELPPRLPVPARRLGQLPDGVTVVAVGRSGGPSRPPGGSLGSTCASGPGQARGAPGAHPAGPGWRSLAHPAGTPARGATAGARPDPGRAAPRLRLG